jgi:hypothetical protein
MNAVRSTLRYTNPLLTKVIDPVRDAKGGAEEQELKPDK